VESKAWAPSRWSPRAVRLYLKHMRGHVWSLPAGNELERAAICQALMTIQIARSKLAIVERYGFRRLEELYPEGAPTEESNGTRRVTSSET
jgi:hypothetical protein